jgi:hypothetical protein
VNAGPKEIFWSLREQGIHPPIRLKYFNDVRFEAIKALWQKICKQWSKQEEKPAKRHFKKPVIKPSGDKSYFDKELFEYQSY